MAIHLSIILRNTYGIILELAIAYFTYVKEAVLNLLLRKSYEFLFIFIILYNKYLYNKILYT